MSGGTVFLFVTDSLGTGDADLGRILMRSFLYSLARDDARPDAMVFMNGGVRLTCTGSESLDDLHLLEQSGVRIYSCGTCLDYFELKDDVNVGRVGNMMDSVAMLSAAGKVVTVG